MKTVTIVEILLSNAVDNKATRIKFIKNDKGDIDLYFRSQNKLKYIDKINKDDYEKILQYFKFKARLYLDEQTGVISFTKDAKQLFVKVEIRTTSSEFEELSLTIHVENKYDTFKDIALFDNHNQLQIIYDMINEAQGGLFIINGLKGEGKTTTAMSLLKKISIENNESIITLENPVEILTKKITQISINEDLGITYGAGLKFAIHQNPHTIFVSKIDSEETFQQIINAVDNGIRVIAITENATNFETIEELQELCNCDEFLQNNLIGISNQRLVVNKQDETKVIFELNFGTDIEKMLKGKKPLSNIYDCIKLYKTNGTIK